MTQKKIKKNKNIFLIGAGGHAFACIDVIESFGYKIKGIYALEKDVGKNILGHKVMGTQYELSKIIKPTDNLHIAVGQTYSKNERIKIFKLFKNKCIFPNIISSYSYISKYTKIGYGTIIMHGAKIGVDTHIGDHTIINTNTSIDHNSTIGSFSHISTSVTSNGNVKIGDNVFIGSGSVLKDSIKISSNQSFKMCSKILKDK